MTLYPAAELVNCTADVPIIYAHLPNVGVAEHVKNSCLHKVFPETQNENLILVQVQAHV